MSNTITSLVPTIYEALDVVSRELVGFIPAVSRNSNVDRAALNQSVLVPVAPAASAADNNPAVSAPNTGDQTIGNISMTIDKSKHVPIRWNGEETRGLLNAGTYNTILRDQFIQAFRTLTNLIETDLFNTTYKNASRAYGSAGTAPFGTAADLSDLAQLRKILDDNGAPQSDLQFVAGSAAMANLRGKQSVLFKVNEAGTDEMLRRGTLGMLEGFAIHNSGAVAVHAKGAGTGYDCDLTAGYAVGDTTIHLDGGTVNTTGIKAGDVITFAGDSNKYIVGTGTTEVEADIVLNSPGLRATLSDTVEATIGNDYTPNMGFSRSAVHLATRLPAMPIGPDGRAMDMADDVMTVVDPVSGIAYEIAVYRQFLQLVYHVRLAWGAQAIKDAHIATLLG